MPFSVDNLRSLMLIAGLGIICWLLLRSKLRSRRRHQPAIDVGPLKHNANVMQTQSTGPGNFRGTASLGAPQEVLRWQVELHELGRELKAELDSKLCALQVLHHRCEQSSRHLEGLLDQLAAQQVAAGGDASQFRSTFDRVRQLSARGWSSRHIAATLALDENQVQTLLEID